MMGRRLDDVIAALPDDRRARVEARFEELRDEVESLGELRRAVGKAQTDIAATLKIKQPSVSKIEKQTDMYLSTLKSYIEAVGGQLDIVVRLPDRPPLHITRLGDIVAPKPVPARTTRTKRSSGARPRIKNARIG